MAKFIEFYDASKKSHLYSTMYSNAISPNNYKDEEVHIKRLIDNVKDLADEIIILNSYSNDKTVEIAEKEQCKIYKNKFVNFLNNETIYLINAK